jgi:hypothetical protein
MAGQAEVQTAMPKFWTAGFGSVTCHMVCDLRFKQTFQTPFSRRGFTPNS